MFCLVILVSFVGCLSGLSDPSPPSNPSCGNSSDYTMVNIKTGYVCIPNGICDYDSCVPNLGKCDSNSLGSNCTFISGDYNGILSYPYAVSTQYCDLSVGGCVGGACGDPVSTSYVSSWGCQGIAAVNPSIFGIDELRNSNSWGQGCTHNSGICYYIEGNNGKSSNVMITDRCAGYCKFNSQGQCDPNGTINNDCGTCVSSTQNPSNIKPNCPCIGTDGNMYTNCCGNESQCNTLDGQCDWCAGNNHAHFDLDIDTFNKICGSDANSGHCILKSIIPYACKQS